MNPTAAQKTGIPSARRWLALGLCLAGVIAYLALNPTFVVRLTVGLSRTYVAGLLLFHVLALSLLYVLARCRRVVAYPILAVLVVSALIDRAMLSIRRVPMTLSEVAVLRAAAGSVGDAMREYGAELLHAGALALLLVAAFVGLRRVVAQWRRAGLAAGGLALASFALFAGVAVRYGEPALIGLPSTGTLPFGGGMLLLDAALKTLSPPQHVPAVPGSRTGSEWPRHVVLVIDESIEGTRFATANTRSFHSAVDLGAGFSAANCSAESNLLLRHAANAQDITVRTQSLFQLASEAGRTTIYVDLQDVLEDVSVRNYFSQAELSFVDHILRGNEFGSSVRRDRALPARVPLLLGEHERTFTIVNKVGTHFPYARRLPPELQGASDPYLAGITYSAVEFLHELESLMPPSTVVFYTSDHGQNLGARSTHCSPEAASDISEWSVPIIVLASEDLGGLLDRIDRRWSGSASHFELAETIRVVLGYEALFNRTLFDEPYAADTPYRAYWGPPGGLLLSPPRYRLLERGSLKDRELTAHVFSLDRE